MDSLFVTCPQGLEQSLVRELQGLGLAGARGTRGGVQIDCDGLEPVYRIALKSRLAHRLLLRLTRFEADDPEAVYRAVGVIDWSDHLALDGSLLVEAKLRDTRLGNPHFVALRVKDAIVDQFRERSGQRPSVDTRQPDLRLNLFVHRRQAELSLDLSGGGLRRAPVGVEAARWRGGLGAALLQLVQWRPTVQSLVVLGAGDVDLLLAAAQLSADVAPGLQLNDVGFERWLGHVPALWQRLCEQARADMRPPDMPRVHVWEERRDTLEAARRACRAAGIENLIDWQLGSAERHAVPDGEGCVVLPPSDAPGHQRATRMRHVEALLQRRFAGWRVASLALGQERERGARWQWRAEQELTVRRGQGRFELAVGAIDARSPVLATRDEPAPVIAFPDAPGEAAAPLINRLQKNLRHLGRWARRQGVSCYRLYDADLPEYAAAIDLYQCEEPWAVVQEYAAPAQLDPERVAQRLQDILACVAQVLELPAERIVLKRRQRQKGSAQYEKLDRQGRFHQVQESGLKLLVNFTDYLDTGLFLDHRTTREELGRKAAGRHVLNLFAYTGAATVHMAAGGARSSTTVDLSKTYLDWARRNLMLNQLAGEAHRFIQADCLVWLDAQAAEPASKRYGLIFMDPPTFSSSKRMEGVLDVQRDHVRLIRAATTLLRPGGELYFSNNFRRFQMDTEALSGLAIEDISARSIPEDFRRNPRIHQCYLIRRPD